MENNKTYSSSNHIPCHFFEQGICRSCTMMNNSIAEGRSKKQSEGLAKVIDAFDGVDLLPFFGMDNFNGSRQKAKLACFSNNDDPQIQLGIYNLKEKISLAECPLYSLEMQAVIKKTGEFLVQAKVLAYDIFKRAGEAKFVLITESLPYEGEKDKTYMVRIVLRSKESLDRIRKLTPDFLKVNPQIKLLSVNIQPEPKAILEGDEEILLSEKNVFINGFANKKLSLTVRSFSQINSIVAFNLYDYVREIFIKNNIKSLLDLYCGVGGFSLNAYDVLENVLGVEISSDAIKMANLTAEKLGRKNFRYKACDVDALLQQNLDGCIVDAVLVNPPRAGLSKKTISFIRESNISHLIYSSCNPETFTRDALILKERYDLVSLKSFDMFMMTDHFEVVGHFKLKN